MLALDIVNDLGIYIRQATRGRIRMEFTAEQLDYLEQRMDDQVTLRNAVIPLESIGNPCYAFLDPDDVMDADSYALISQEESLAAGQREMHKLEDPDFEQLLGGEGDLFQTYAINAIALRGIRRAEADARGQQRMQEVYGFIPEDTVQVSEQRHQNALRTEKQAPLEVGRPVAYKMGSRVVILTAADPNSNPDVTAGRPEALFNQTLRRRSSEIYDLPDSTDVRYKISSPEFREMKRALDKVRNVRPLGTDRAVDRQQELEKARLRFETLLEKTNAYLGKKPPHNEKKYTNDRIQAAKKMREYAELKLRELELVEKARNTPERYKGMSDDEIRRATSAENAEIARMKAQDERREDSVGWLGELNDRYYRQGLSQTFWHGFAHEVDELRGFERDENGVFVSDDEGALAAEAKRPAGYSVAGQLILRERTQREKGGLNGAGPLEAALHDGRAQWQQDWIQTLDTMLGLVQASKPFHDMIAAFYLMGDQPDISEIPSSWTDSPSAPRWTF